MQGIHAAPKEDSAVSATEMVFGSPLTLPGQILTEEDMPADSIRGWADSAVEQFVAASRSYMEVACGILRTLADTEMVYVRCGAVSPPLKQGYSSPFRVLERSPRFPAFRWETERR